MLPDESIRRTRLPHASAMKMSPRRWSTQSPPGFDNCDLAAGPPSPPKPGLPFPAIVVIIPRESRRRGAGCRTGDGSGGAIGIDPEYRYSGRIDIVSGAGGVYLGEDGIARGNLRHNSKVAAIPCSLSIGELRNAIRLNTEDTARIDGI